MRRLVLGPAILLFVWFSIDLSSQTPASRGQARDTEEIVGLLHQWTDAMSRGDAKVLDQLLADNFTFVSPRGRLILRATYVANRDATRGASFATESARFDDVSVRFYGAFAVSTSRYTTTARTKDAGIFLQQTSGEYTRTDTWIRGDGRWRAVASQLTPIGYAGAHAATESAALRGIDSGDLKWAESTVYPGAQVAVLHGQPYTGGFAVRMKRPAGHFEKPHRHESDEHVSILSGTLHIGVGAGSNRTSASAFRAGGYVVIPSGTLHHSWTEGALLADIHWTGPAAPVSGSERTEISMPRATLASYAGTYRFDGSATTLTITLEGDQLMGRLSGAPAPFPIFAESETRFFLRSAPPGSSVGVNQPIEFVKDASSVVTGVSLGNRKARRVSQTESTATRNKLPSVAYLGGNRSVLEDFLTGMRDLGYVAERTFHFEARLTEGSAEKQRQFATDLVALRPDVIVATGTASLDLGKLTSTIPIVLTHTPESTALKIIDGLEHPGRNVTGVVARESARIQKELSLLKDVVPGLTRVAMLADASLARPLAPETLAPSMGLHLDVIPLASGDQLQTAFNRLSASSPGALFVGGGPLLLAHMSTIAKLATARKWPSISESRELPASGGLMSYGGWGNGPRLAARYVDRILKGARPGDLPVELQQEWQLVINLESAKQLGLTIPDSVLAQAAELIRP